MAGKFAKTLTAMCVRYTELEDIHAGITLVTKTGDYYERCTDAWDEPKPVIDEKLNINRP